MNTIYLLALVLTIEGGVPIYLTKTFTSYETCMQADADIRRNIDANDEWNFDGYIARCKPRK
jgi:hypothetical protein